MKSSSGHIPLAWRKTRYQGVLVWCIKSESLPNTVLFTLYYSLIHQRVIYYNKILSIVIQYYFIEVWGSTDNVHIEPLYILQKQSVRLIAVLPPRAHTSSKFQYILKLNENYLFIWLAYSCINALQIPIRYKTFLSALHAFCENYHYAKTTLL